LAGIKLTHIAYNGSAPALTDVIGDRVPIMFDLWSSAKPYVADGRLKVLAVASAQRLQDAPQYPTLAETFPGFDVSAFQALAVPKGAAWCRPRNSPKRSGRSASSRKRHRRSVRGSWPSSRPERNGTQSGPCKKNRNCTATN
jgi:hypothetical protein